MPVRMLPQSSPVDHERMAELDRLIAIEKEHPPKAVEYSTRCPREDRGEYFRKYQRAHAGQIARKLRESRALRKVREKQMNAIQFAIARVEGQGIKLREPISESLEKGGSRKEELPEQNVNREDGGKSSVPARRYVSPDSPEFSIPASKEADRDLKKRNKRIERNMIHQALAFNPAAPSIPKSEEDYRCAVVEGQRERDLLREAIHEAEGR